MQRATISDWVVVDAADRLVGGDEPTTFVREETAALVASLMGLDEKGRPYRALPIVEARVTTSQALFLGL
jgi:hypothetical protein